MPSIGILWFFPRHMKILQRDTCSLYRQAPRMTKQQTAVDGLGPGKAVIFKSLTSSSLSSKIIKEFYKSNCSTHSINTFVLAHFDWPTDEVLYTTIFHTEDGPQRKLFD